MLLSVRAESRTNNIKRHFDPLNVTINKKSRSFERLFYYLKFAKSNSFGGVSLRKCVIK